MLECNIMHLSSVYAVRWKKKGSISRSPLRAITRRGSASENWQWDSQLLDLLTLWDPTNKKALSLHSHRPNRVTDDKGWTCHSLTPTNPSGNESSFYKLMLEFGLLPKLLFLLF